MKKFHLFFLCALVFGLAACSNSKQQTVQDDVLPDDTMVDDAADQSDGPDGADTVIGDELPIDGDAPTGDELVTDDIVTDHIANDDILADEDGLLPDEDTVQPLSCGELADCRNDCGGDQPCIDACVAAGSTEAQGEFDALATCAETYCATECGASGTPDGCEDCAVIHCTSEVNACYDKATTLTCAQILGCRGGCGDDQTCIDACVAAGSTEEQGAYNTLFACVDTDCAIECGTSGTSQDCETCVNANCAVELNACYIDENATVYGTLAVNATFNYIYDGNSDMPPQIQAHPEGVVSSSVFSGTYAAGNISIPPTASQSQTASLAMHLAATASNPARVVAHMQVSTQAGIVNPMVQLLFPDDAIIPGTVSMDASKEGSGFTILLNSTGTGTRCLLAISFGGTVTVTAAANTDQVSGGSLAFNGSGIMVYYPAETPLGDLSDANTCPKE